MRAVIRIVLALLTLVAAFNLVQGPRADPTSCRCATVTDEQDVP